MDRNKERVVVVVNKGVTRDKEMKASQAWWPGRFTPYIVAGQLRQADEAGGRKSEKQGVRFLTPSRM